MKSQKMVPCRGEIGVLLLQAVAGSSLFDTQAATSGTELYEHQIIKLPDVLTSIHGD